MTPITLSADPTLTATSAPIFTVGVFSGTHYVHETHNVSDTRWFRVTDLESMIARYLAGMIGEKVRQGAPVLASGGSPLSSAGQPVVLWKVTTETETPAETAGAGAIMINPTAGRWWISAGGTWIPSDDLSALHAIINLATFNNLVSDAQAGVLGRLLTARYPLSSWTAGGDSDTRLLELPIPNASGAHLALVSDIRARVITPAILPGTTTTITIDLGVKHGGTSLEGRAIGPKESDNSTIQDLQLARAGSPWVACNDFASVPADTILARVSSVALGGGAGDNLANLSALSLEVQATYRWNDEVTP